MPHIERMEMDAILPNVFVGVLTGGAWGTRNGYGIWATIFAWFVIIGLSCLIGAVFYTLLKSNGDDREQKVENDTRKLEWADMVLDDDANEIESPISQGVKDETAWHDH